MKRAVWVVERLGAPGVWFPYLVVMTREQARAAADAYRLDTRRIRKYIPAQKGEE